MTVDDFIGDYNWEYALSFGNERISTVLDEDVPITAFTCSDVSEVLATDEGENDGPSWVAIIRLTDGRFVFIESGCDYTGWDCQASGQSVVSRDYDALVRFGLSVDDRRRLNCLLPEDEAQERADLRERVVKLEWLVKTAEPFTGANDAFRAEWIERRNTALGETE